MAKVKWSNYALDDMHQIHEFFKRDSLSFANRLLDRLVQKVDLLEKNPRIGRKVPEFEDDIIRELFEGNYRIIYRIKSEILVEVVRIHHSSKPLGRIKK